MLHLKKVLGAKPKEHVERTLLPLTTPWSDVAGWEDGGGTLEAHPDPQFARISWEPLNGWWDCAFVPDAYTLGEDLLSVVASAQPPSEWAHRIHVPFSPEAPLSGVDHQLQVGELLWYRRTVAVSQKGGTHLIHFQAVDAVCAVWCNGQLLGTHAGGYTPFSFDVTNCIGARKGGAHAASQSVEILICVADPSEFGGQLRGKQRKDRGDIWYTAQSGIWQSVWLETVPRDHITALELHPDAQMGILAVGLRLSTQERHEVRLEVLDAEGVCVGTASCETDEATEALALHIPAPRLWSPDDPYLYRLRLVFGEDVVHSYCAFRTVEMKRDSAGVLRVHLNGEPIFLKGVLDQAYWPDGLLTAPTDAALAYDIEAMREAGFNMMRKHIKIENARWYFHCDRLGMLVWQDMVTGGEAELNDWVLSYKPTLFKISWGHYRDTVPAHQRKLGAGSAAYQREWMDTCRETVKLLKNHPCIITWVLFNEGWGQFNARGACAMVRMLDPTRPIDAVSGWYDQHCGDFYSVHNYFRDMVVWRDAHCWRDGGQRAFVVSECGGFSHRIDGHSALDETYGYEVYDDLATWRGTVRSLLACLDALEAKGLAGYVYTQVSDIEEEMNGLLSYDRRVNKLVAE